ncbi:MAG: hypothetical protein EA390_13820 [Balneolaceae bacterium]|nr:MAG: hypothetical protein EA390_13820 [Balneolaceae bacterium]
MNYPTTLLFIIALFLTVNCETTAIPPAEELMELELISRYPLNIRDPSGLTLDISGKFLWTVSDDPRGHIYKIGFTGEILEVLTDYEGDDLEGITINPNDSTLWVA